jgi:hypothetical protein
VVVEVHGGPGRRDLAGLRGGRATPVLVWNARHGDWHIVRGMLGMKITLILLASAMLLLNHAEAVDRWALWQISQNGKADIYLRDATPGFGGVILDSEARCQIMAEMVRRDHLVELAEVNSMLAKRGKPPLAPYVKYECRRHP